MFQKMFDSFRLELFPPVTILYILHYSFEYLQFKIFCECHLNVASADVAAGGGGAGPLHTPAVPHR